MINCSWCGKTIEGEVVKSQLHVNVMTKGFPFHEDCVEKWDEGQKVGLGLDTVEKTDDPLELSLKGGRG